MLKNTILISAIFLAGNLIGQQKQLSDYIKINKAKNFNTYKSNTPITTEKLVKLYKADLGLSENDELNFLKKEEDKLNIEHSRYQQYHEEIEVYGAQYLVHEKEQNIIFSNGKLVFGISANNNNAINTNSAIQNAISFIGAEKYMWENVGAEKLIKKIKKNAFATYYPEAELVYFDKYFTQVGSNYRLAYKVEVYAEKPLSKQDVFVDAQTGQILHAYNKIHTTEVTGVANTKYAGTQSIQVDSLSTTSYRLREFNRGGGIETYNMLQGTDYALAVDFTDTDNIWSNVNAQQDEAATDAHWAAEMTYDYFLSEHGRDSYDGAGAPLLSYVHYDANYSNAFWDGVRMTYGDGDGTTYTALTSLDVGGHEIAHGVTEYTANLVYQNESGALNESFSDIFGTSIEFFADPANADWTVGEDFDVAGNGFRSMSDPNSVGDPDTYLGANWEFTAADNGGVHTNSSVQNYWFYLLSVGGSGTNDNGDGYNVSGIGIDTAAAIAYRNLSVYLTQSSEYIDARNGAIQSAEDLYGACSNAVIQTSKAWAAVGVGFAIEDNDLTVISIDAPSTGCGLTNTENVTIKIRNNGCLVDLITGTNIPVAFQIDGGAIVNEVITLGSNFNAGDTISYMFTATGDLSTIGMHGVSSWVSFGLDNQSLNDSIINVQVENKLQQNVDLALVNILSPNSGCHLTSTENVEVAFQFLGCDSLTSGTNIDLEFQLDGGTIVNETLTLPSTIYAEDTVYYTFTSTADLSLPGIHSLSSWTAFSIDNINDNDTIPGLSIKHPVPLFDNQLVTFENTTMVLDTMILTSNIESEASVSNASAATGSYALRLTGGDPLASGITPDLDSNGFWTNNMEFAATAKFCVDATGWSVATLNFDLRQTNSMVYSFQFGQSVPAASSMRLVVNGTQIGGTYIPVTEINDPFTPYQINLNAYAGTEFELIFETRMGFSEAADPLTILGSEGDNAYIDNVIFTQNPVGVQEIKTNNEIVIYPNPNNGIFSVQLTASKNQEVNIGVYNVLGGLISSQSKSIMTGKNQIEINMTKQVKGIYLLKVTSGETSNVVRIVKN